MEIKQWLKEVESLQAQLAEANRKLEMAREDINNLHRELRRYGNPYIYSVTMQHDNYNETLTIVSVDISPQGLRIIVACNKTSIQAEAGSEEK